MFELFIRLSAILVILIIGLSLFFFFLPLIIIIGIIAFALKLFFGVNVIKTRKIDFRTARRAPAPEPDTDVPANEAVIDTEAVEIENAPQR